MLVGFFKEISAKDCDVQVIGFSDRIWANPDLSATLFRVFSADGSQSENRVKLIWQLDELLERDKVDPNQPVSTSSYVRLSGSLIESDDGKPIRDLKDSVSAAEKGLDAAQIRITDLKTEVRWATIIAIVGAIIAVAAFLYDLFK
jgi:hypothetical protein